MISKEELKLKFQEERHHLCRDRAKLLMIFGITLVPIFSGLDYLTSPKYFHLFLKIRLVNTLENVMFLLILHFVRSLSLRQINLIVVGACFSTGAMIAYMCGVLGGYESPYYAGIILVLMGMVFVMPWHHAYTTITCLLCYLAYLLLAYTPNGPLKDLANNSYFLISTLLLSTASTYFANKLRLPAQQNKVRKGIS